MFIASCPECGDSLTFPSGVALSSKCRCPLCTETFTLEDCLSELPPMAEVLGGGETGSGLSPAYGGGAALATAPRTASPSRAGSTATAGPRTGARAPARKAAKGGNPIMQFAQIIVGGVVGISLAILIIWWVIGTDPFGLAPTVAQYAPFLVPEKFRGGSALDFPEDAATNGEKAPAQGNSRRPQRGMQLDGSRFATEEEQQNPQRGAPRTSLDPDAGELAPVVESGEDLFAPSGTFSSPFEEPSLGDFAPNATELAPVESTPDASSAAEPSEPTLDPLLTEPSLDPTLTEPSLDPTLSDPSLEPAPTDSALGPLPGERPLEEPMVEEGAFQLKPFSPDASTEDATAVDPTVAAANDPFSLVFPTATEDLPDLAAAEGEAWQVYAATADQPPAARKKPAEDHYEQVATVAQTLAGLPPSPRANAAVAETTQKLADRFDEEGEQRVANFLGRQRLTNVDFNMAGVVVVGRVIDVKPEGELAVVTLSLDTVKNEADRRVVALVREAQGIPAKDSLIVAMGVKHPGDPTTLPESLAGEKAPIVLAGAVAEVGTPPASDPAPAEPAPTEPAPESDPAPADPAPTEPPSEEPAPADPASAEEPSTEPAPQEPSSEEPAPEVPAPAEEAPGEAPAEEPAPAEAGETP